MACTACAFAGVRTSFRFARRTHAVLWPNTGLALGIKLAILGSATTWMVVFADMGASLIVIANGLRASADAD